MYMYLEIGLWRNGHHRNGQRSTALYNVGAVQGLVKLSGGALRRSEGSFDTELGAGGFGLQVNFTLDLRHQQQHHPPKIRFLLWRCRLLAWRPAVATSYSPG